MKKPLKPENLSLLKAARKNENFKAHAVSIINPRFAGHVAKFFAIDDNASDEDFHALSTETSYHIWWLFIAYTLETNPMSLYCASLLNNECRIAWNRLALIAMVEKQNQSVERQHAANLCA